MLFGFAICIALGHLALWALVFGIQVLYDHCFCCYSYHFHLYHFGSPTALISRPLFLQIMMFREIVRISRRVAMERAAPGQAWLQWYWFIVSTIFINLRTLKRHYEYIEVLAPHSSGLPRNIPTLTNFCFGFFCRVLTLRVLPFSSNTRTMFNLSSNTMKLSASLPT
jgi:hypothetical protein